MHTPRKRFGQHFLCDQSIIHRIIDALHPKAAQHLIEIGPGQGALTVPMLQQIKQLEVIELDRDLVHELKHRNRENDDLIVHEADALEFDFASLKNDDRLLRVFGNLPYNISTPLIFHLLNFSDIISDMLFMLQKEVAKRMAADAGSKDYGRLSVMVQYHCRVELLFDVPASAFYPPPQVVSSIVKLVPHREYPYRAQNYPLFESVVKHVFGQRRKTLRNSLREMIDDDVWAHINIRSDLRAENLSVKDFVEICNVMSARG